MLSISGRHSRSSHKWWVFKVGNEGREEGGRGNGEVDFDFLFFFSFLSRITATNHIPTVHASFSAQFFVLSWTMQKLKYARIASGNETPWEIGQGFAFRRRFISRLYLSNYLVRVVSISDATNWKFSAGQSLKIQDYQTATISFFYYFLLLHYIVVIILLFITV